jgi:hypothetical protein
MYSPGINNYGLPVELSIYIYMCICAIEGRWGDIETPIPILFCYEEVNLPLLFLDHFFRCMEKDRS